MTKTYFSPRFDEANVQASWTEQAIAITDKMHPHYERVSDEWLQSNPRGYAEWFKSRMAVELRLKKTILAEKMHAKVEDVPTWRVKTPLQQVIQLLKKHRDEMFATDPDDKPISIIITTLAAHVYENEPDVAQALGRIANNMSALVEKRNGVWWIRNPVNPLENFADRWQQFPERRDAFFSWAKRLQDDLTRAAQLTDLEDIGGTLHEAYGDMTVANVLRKHPGVPRGGLRPSMAKLDVSHKKSPPWKMAISGKAAITARIVHGLYGTEIFSDGPPIAKGKSLRFKVTTNIDQPYDLHWQVVNTGDEAKHDLRGDFYDSDSEPGRRTKKENTKYKGRHWVECFVVKNGVCVARTGEFYVNIQ
jgi:hypothetical protein